MKNIKLKSLLTEFNERRIINAIDDIEDYVSDMKKNQYLGSTKTARGIGWASDLEHAAIRIKVTCDYILKEIKKQGK